MIAEKPQVTSQIVFSSGTASASPATNYSAKRNAKFLRRELIISDQAAKESTPCALKT
jgi:hypothetical protein